MADLTPEEARQWLGGRTPSEAEIRAQSNQMQNDPFALWWQTFVEGSGPAAQALQAGGGGPKPIRTPNEAAALGGSYSLARDVRNAPEMDAIFRAGANAPNRQNPYSAQIADQTRAGQIALINQMRGQMNGPSIANMQGQRALGQSGQQALMNSALGGGRAAMLQSANVGQGLAGDVGQARLGEVMRAQAGMGGAAGNLRGGDLRSADAQMQAALQQRKQDDTLRQFYAAQGANLQGARDQATTNREATRLQLLSKGNKRDMQTGLNFLNSASTMFGGIATGGK